MLGCGHGPEGRPAPREISENPAYPRPLLSLDAFRGPQHRRQHELCVWLATALTGERRSYAENLRGPLAVYRGS